MTATDTMTQTFATCPQCRTRLPTDSLVCTSCGRLLHGDELQHLAAQAIELERTDPQAAAQVWKQCLPLLPTDSQQHEDVSQRVTQLSAGLAYVAQPRQSQRQHVTAYDPEGDPDEKHDHRPVIEKGSDPLPLALTKTIGSMAVSILAYMWFFRGDWQLAVGFVLLILVHEMGHVFALKYYGYSASPPIFIPFMGALINLRQPPRNAWEEAVIGIGGPVLGTLGALAFFAVWRFFPGYSLAPLCLELAVFGFMLNFFNMLPIPPLDGGRITAAISPWVWVAGILAMGYWLYADYVKFGRLNFIIVMVLFFALPRIRDTLTNPAIRNHPYYKIGRQASWTMGVAYVALAAVLAVYYFGYRGVLFA